jgi:putative spermidine/putrescine transport system substrate-binding protein
MNVVLKHVTRLSAGFLTLLAILSIGSIAPAEEVTLRVANYGGEYQEFANRYLNARFTAETGIKIDWIVANPIDQAQKLIATKGRSAPYDVVHLDDKAQIQAIKAGVLMKLDQAIVTNLSRLYDAAKEKEGYGPAQYFLSWGLFYNEKALRDNGIPPPTSWEDLWDPKLAGKVAISDVAAPGGVDFVLKAAQLAGGNEANLTPGLDKIASLKLQSFYSSSNDLRTKLLSGSVWIAPWNNGRSWSLINSGFTGKFVYPKEGGFLHSNRIDVVAGTKYPKEAQLYVNYALDPLYQLALLYFPYGPANKSVDQVLKDYPQLAQKVPASSDLSRLSMPDWATVYDNYPGLVDSWNRLVKARK